MTGEYTVSDVMADANGCPVCSGEITVMLFDVSGFRIGGGYQPAYRGKSEKDDKPYLAYIGCNKCHVYAWDYIPHYESLSFCLAELATRWNDAVERKILVNQYKERKEGVRC